jgi:hypothetical protein
MTDASKPHKCPHPKESRSLLSGYDVVCDECEQIIGRVALFPCAVLSADEARALIDGENGRTGREAQARLEQAVRT